MAITELKVQYSHFPFASKFSELGRVVESGTKITLDLARNLDSNLTAYEADSSKFFLPTI